MAAESDKQGRASFAVPKGYRCRVEIRAPGYAASNRVIGPSDAHTEIPLSAESTLTLVLDDPGESQPELVLFDCDHPGRVVARQTAEGGRVTFRGLSGGAYIVVDSWFEGYAGMLPRNAPDGTKVYEAALRVDVSGGSQRVVRWTCSSQTTRIEGRVHPMSGFPMPEVLRISPQNIPGGQGLEVPIDDRGFFVTPRLVPGNYVVSVYLLRSVNFVPVREPIPVLGGRDTWVDINVSWARVAVRPADSLMYSVRILDEGGALKAAKTATGSDIVVDVLPGKYRVEISRWHNGGRDRVVELDQEMDLLPGETVIESR